MILFKPSRYFNDSPKLRELFMKEFWISVAVAIAVVVGGLAWLGKASEQYADQHPELALQAKQSVEGYNAAVEVHNAKIASGKKD